jgi:hypothetical protein
MKEKMHSEFWWIKRVYGGKSSNLPFLIDIFLLVSSFGRQGRKMEFAIRGAGVLSVRFQLLEPEGRTRYI